MRRALQYQRLCGGTIALHEEDPELSGDGVMHEGPVSAALGLAGIPAVSEATMIARDAALAAYEDARIHVQHLSAAESVEAVRAARAAGVAISAEASPHHLCLTDEEVRSLDPNRFKMNPPLRSERDRQALIEGLRDGTIECIATDHAPHALHEKDVPFEAAPFGVTGLETAFAVLYSRLVQAGLLPLETLLERMSAGPARIFGIDRPRVAVGATANLTLLDLEREWDVDPNGFRSRSRNSWLLGARLTGAVAMTIANGAVAFEA
jgi:dihydroorotase